MQKQILSKEIQALQNLGLSEEEIAYLAHIKAKSDARRKWR